MSNLGFEILSVSIKSWYQSSKLNKNIICLSTLSLISISLLEIFLSSILTTLEKRSWKCDELKLRKGLFNKNDFSITFLAIGKKSRLK